MSVLTRQGLEPLVLEAIRNQGGSAPLREINKFVWAHYEADLRASGDFFYV